MEVLIEWWMEKSIEQLPIKRQSPHHNLWSDSLKVLSMMHFVDKNEKKIIVPTQNNR